MNRFLKNIVTMHLLEIGLVTALEGRLFVSLF
jgi:hypothetical protein